MTDGQIVQDLGAAGRRETLQRRNAQLTRDISALLELQRASWAINFPKEQFSEAASRHVLERGLQRDLIYVYEHQGELVGWLWLDLKGAWGVPHVRHIQVVSEQWGRGYGAAIMRDAITIVAEHGLKALTLNVTKSNVRAMQLYAVLGFRIDQDNGERQRMRLCLDDGGVNPTLGRDGATAR